MKWMTTLYLLRLEEKRKNIVTKIAGAKAYKDWKQVLAIVCNAARTRVLQGDEETLTLVSEAARGAGANAVPAMRGHRGGWQPKGRGKGKGKGKAKF